MIQAGVAGPENHDIILECSHCKRCWVKLFKLPMMLRQFVQELKDAKCPQCGNQAGVFMLMGERYKKAKAELENES